MELMIVVAIIGVLAAIAIPAYQGYVARSQMAEAFSLAMGLKPQVVAYYSAFGVCPDNGSSSKNSTNFAKPSLIAGRYVVASKVGVDKANYCSIWVKMKATGVQSGIANKILNLELRKDSGPGSFIWGCISNASPKYLPASCEGDKTLNNVSFD